MLARPDRVLIAATCFVGLTMFAAPFVTGVHVYGASTWWRLVSAQIGAGLLNAVVFLVFGGAIWTVARKRWPTYCSIAIIAWCVCYFVLLWLLFLQTCW